MILATLAMLGATAGGALSGCSPTASGGAASSADVPTASAASPAERTGAALFSANCAPCHQQNAQGIPNVYPSLVGSPLVLGDPKAFALWVVEGRRAASMTPGRYATAMPRFGWMKGSDAAALLIYLRANFGNSAPPIEPAALAATMSAALGE
jgi:mono/diheme cytochrome c family protein